MKGSKIFEAIEFGAKPTPCAVHPATCEEALITRHFYLSSWFPEKFLILWDNFPADLTLKRASVSQRIFLSPGSATLGAFSRIWMGPLPRIKNWPHFLPSNRKKASNMITYEFYWVDELGESHYFGTLPERRNPERITEESIMNWGTMMIGNKAGVKKIYFIRVEEQR